MGQQLWKESGTLPLAGCGRAQRREVSPNALGIDPEIAAPIARRRAQVDAAARACRSDADDDIVGKAHPAASLARLDPACRLVRRDDRPTHSLRHIKRSRECYIGCQSDGQRDNVRIGPPLLFGNPGAFIGNRIDAFVLPQRGNRDKGWRIVRIGGDVVDWWHRLTDLVVMPRHVGNQATPDKRHDGERDAPPIEPREPNDKCYYRDDHDRNPAPLPTDGAPQVGRGSKPWMIVVTFRRRLKYGGADPGPGSPQQGRRGSKRGSARAAETRASLSAGRSACPERCMVLSSRCRVVRRIRKTRGAFVTPHL